MPILFWNSIDGTILGACLVIRAEFLIPLISSVAVLISIDSVDPSPVGIQDNGLVFFITA